MLSEQYVIASEQRWSVIYWLILIMHLLSNCTTVSCWSLVFCCLTFVVQRSVVDLWCCVVLPLSYWSSLTVIMFSSVLELWWTCATVLAAVTVDARVSNNTVHVDGVWYVTLTLSVQMSTQVSVHIEMIRYSAPKELISCLVVSDV